MVMREYNLGCTLKECANKFEYWELIALLYASNQHIEEQNEAMKEAELKQKIESGKVNTYFKGKK